MGPDLRIDWSEVCANSADFERLVKLLLLKLYPGGEVFDGSGGDGGREFQIRTEETLTLYEAKSFTNRLSARNPNRRVQVERSLVSAARHQPDIWHLVVPIDHNPDEQKWFDALRIDFPFVGRWLGMSWLEAQLLDHGDLLRYATQNKLLEYVRHYNIEQAALAGGVPDLLDRYDALAKLGDELSPDWRPVVGQFPDGARVVQWEAKHRAASEDDPILFRLTAQVPISVDTQRLRDELRSNRDYGTRVEIPGEYISQFEVTGPSGLGRLGPEGDVDRLIIAADEQRDRLPLLTISALAPNATWPLAMLSFVTESRTVGSAGARLVSHDMNRTVRLISEVRRDRSLNINLQMTADSATPAAMLPALRLMRELHAPNALQLLVEVEGQRSTHQLELTDPAPRDQEGDQLFEFVEDLTVIQDRLRQPFAIPSTIRPRDLERAAKLRRLVNGERVPWRQGPLSVVLDPSRIADFKEQFRPDSSEGGFLRIASDDEVLRIGEQDVHTGPIFMVARVAVDLDTIPDEPPGGLEVTAEFNVLGDGWFYAEQGEPEPSGVTSNTAPPGHARVAYHPTQQPHRDVAD